VLVSSQRSRERQGANLIEQFIVRLARAYASIATGIVSRILDLKQHTLNVRLEPARRVTKDDCLAEGRQVLSEFAFEAPWSRRTHVPRNPGRPTPIRNSFPLNLYVADSPTRVTGWPYNSLPRGITF